MQKRGGINVEKILTPTNFFDMSELRVGLESPYGGSFMDAEVDDYFWEQGLGHYQPSILTP